MSNISFEDFKNGSKTHNASTNKAFITQYSAGKAPELKPDSFNASNSLEEAKRQNGLIEKIADKIKGSTGIGLSSKKIQKSIDEGKNQEQIEKDIKNYRRAQENVAQTTADTASGLAGIFSFFGIKQLSEILVSKHYKINQEPMNKIIKYNLKEINKENLAEPIIKLANKKGTYIATAAIAAGLIAGMVKSNLLKLNRIGTKQYKPEINEEEMSKKEIKQAKKKARKAKKNANRRNFISGSINGLTAPVLSILGIAGAPIYIGINSLSKYFIASCEDKKEKSFNSYVENLKNSPITNIIGATSLLIPAITKGKYDKIFNKNLDKVVKNLEKAQLVKGKEVTTTYQQLENILFSDKTIQKALSDGKSASDKIQNLSDANIFSLKFKQIKADDDEITRALKQSCPATRAINTKNGIKGAQEIVNEAFGESVYKIKKLVGVGTVAESYLVEDKTGKEFCIKILKEGISAEKIQKDKKAFIEIINNLEGKTKEEKEFLIANVESIADGVLKEVDFNNEMKAARELATVTKKAKVVQPSKVSKDGSVYVMEKADGISLADFSDYMLGKRITKSSEELQKEFDKAKKFLEEQEKLLADYEANLDKYNTFVEEHPEFKKAAMKYSFFYGIPNGADKETIEEFKKIAQPVLEVSSTTSWDFDKLHGNRKLKGVEALKRKIKNGKKDSLQAEQALNARNSYTKLKKEGLDLDNLSKEDAKRLLETYQDVLVEQFNKVDEKGKIIHGDIHPGNVFIDFDKLKKGDKKFLTLIDTGNTISQNTESAIRFMNLSKYIDNADIDNITKFVLEGAALPDKMSEEEAFRLVSQKLKSILFDNKTDISTVTNDNLLAITDSILQEAKIVPSDTQGNLMKAKKSADTSLKIFSSNLLQAVGEKLEKETENLDESNIKDTAKLGLKAASEFTDLGMVVTRKNRMAKIQEKKNLKNLSLQQRASLKKSKSAPDKNSEEYLTYLLKQGKAGKDSSICTMADIVDKFEEIDSSA